eukprot:47656-Eustigmatos_ZCMA.PRE.1
MAYLTGETGNHSLANKAKIMCIDVDARVVLAHLPGGYHEWVTWSIYKKDGDADWNCWNGAYSFT